MNGLDEIIAEEEAINLAIDTAIYSYLQRRTKIYADIQVTDLVYCPRRAYFEKKYGKKHNSNDFSLIVGILIHDFMLQALAEELNADNEVLTVEVFNIDGDFVKVYAMCDLLTDKYVLELKTCGRLPDTPRESHLMQLEAYLRFFNREYGYLVYVNRNNGDRRIFKHYRDDTIYDEFKNRLDDFYVSLKYDRIPFYYNESLCKFGKRKCPYYDMCYESSAIQI